MPSLLHRLAQSRTLKLAALAAGSWRFWAATALAAGAATVALVIYNEIHADPTDKGSYGYKRLVDNTGATASSNPNPSPRILLMNPDRHGECFVDCDNISGATTGTKTNRNWWEYLNDEAVKLTGYNLVKGTEFKLHEKGDDGRTLWHMKYCRAGNLNPTSTSKTPQDYQNELPFNTTSAYSYKTRTLKATQITAGTLVMQNTPEAEVISSCLPDGIGTIYFDAVNGFTGYLKGRLQVQVAYGVYVTNKWGKVEDATRANFVLEKDAVGNFVPPDDAHCDAYEIIHEGEDPLVIPYDRVAWVTVNLSGKWSCNDQLGDIPTGEVLNLKMPESGTAAGTFENFYRAWAPIADNRINPAVEPYARLPMRFRIKRLDDPAVEGTLGMSLDGENLGTQAAYKALNGLLILDNIIASYPPMKAWAIPPNAEYVNGGGPRNVIGWTGIVEPTKYPAAGERNLSVRAGIDFATNAPPGVTSDWIGGTTANFTYRWRYREQLTNDWADLPMTVVDDTNLVSTVSFDLPAQLGDIEFKYTTDLDAPYYDYLDYSGSTKLEGTPGYSERVKSVESRFNPEARGAAGGIPALLPSCGEDFFFRLRPGASDQLEYRLEVRKPDKTEIARTQAFWLTTNCTWRTYLKTTTNETSATALPVGDYEFRVVGVNPAWAFGGGGTVSIPCSGQALTTNDMATVQWTKFHVDALTGALLYQLVEDPENPEILTYSIVHADFQDFNNWSDAKTVGGLYTGAFVDDGGVKRGKQSGSSPDARTYPGELPQWSATGSGSHTAFWSEDFSGHSPKDPSGTPAYRPYETFRQSRTINGWIARYSQWSHAKWRTDSNGMALLMSGDGDGMIDYARSDIPAPHGIDKVTFDARVAQAAKFKEFVTYQGAEEIEEMTDYLFMTRAVMSTTDAATTFHGNGTVSLVGYYQPGEGCYELRAERSGDNEISIYLYKWVYDAGADEPLPHLLGRYNGRPAMNTATYLRCSNKGGTSTEQSSGSYGELFIRCTTATGKTVVEAGVMNASKKLADSTSGTSHYCLKYEDTGSNPDLGAPLTYGTFGFGSLNCPAQIINPVYYADGAKATVPNVTGKSADGPDVNNPKSGTGAVSYAGDENHVFKISSDLSKYKNWSIKSNKFTLTKVGGENSVEAAPQSGTVELFTWPKDKSVETDATLWEPPVTVVGFTNNACSFDLRNDEDTFLRLATAARSSDILIDNIKFGQWCAANYSDTDNADFYNRGDWSIACPTNFVYMNGWVTVDGDAHTIDLQPLRGRAGQPVAIRAPLMDGLSERGYPYPRGIGLGTFTFTFRDADEHCVLKVQYKEMSGASDLADATASVDGWTDFETIDFGQMTAAERKNGRKITVALGLHATAGVMRLVVDKQVVEDARDGEKNPTGDPAYGAVTITGFSATDEPPLDGLCWRAWNLRTSDDPQELSLYDSMSAEPTFALALNNSAEDDIEIEEGETGEEARKRFALHVPYVQSPTFFTNLINEVSFTARKLSADDPDTEVVLLGATDGGEPDDVQWEVLKTFVVRNAVFSETYVFKTKSSRNYRSFRLAVIGVDGVAVNYKDAVLPDGTRAMKIPAAERILIDELSVSEGIYGQIRLFDVGAFRSPLDRHEYVPNLFGIEQQPMCEESWSVQCEVRAVQLEDEISLGDDTEVTLHWIVTNHEALASANWGYGNWARSPAAQSAPLARVENKDLPAELKGKFVFRGSYPASGTAVVEPNYESGTVVQYMLEVKYRTSDGEWAEPYLLQPADWAKPAWYRGVDYNAQYGGFAAYTILDSIAYGYAWINEVNVYDGPDPDRDISGTNQFVEVAIPEYANISGWKLQFITGGLDENPDAPVYTNTVATFTDDSTLWSPGHVPSTKDLSPYGDEDSTYVFLAVGNKASATPEMTKDRYIDGVWKVRDEDQIGYQVNRSTGYIDCGMPIGIRLVRPSGIVEHEIVVAGTNRWDFYGPPYSWVYSATNYLARMQRLEPDGSWTGPCADAAFPQDRAISVVNSTNVTTDASVWEHWTKTPGRVNMCNGVKQFIDPGFPKPQGTMIRLYAQIEGGYFNQTIGEFVHTVSNVVLFVPKGEGLPNGTNITYQITNCWYELASVTETCKDWTREHPEKVGSRGTFCVPVAANASNDVKVVAKTRVRADVEAALGPDNDYREAILKWLEAGQWGPRGNRQPFKNPGEIHPTAFHGYSCGYIRDLRLTETYWLDIDPTAEGTVFKAGMCEPPQPKRPHIGPGQESEEELDRTDIVLGVFMKIYNEAEGWAYAPYTLNGINPGVSTMDHPADWNSVTFKITGYLQNGLDATKDPAKKWMPLRYFVFDENSFGLADDPPPADAKFRARIQVKDPFAQFADWEPFEGCPVYFRWDIDTRKFGAVGNDVLRPDSTFSK